MGFAWNLILFSFVREREGYKHHADCTVVDQDQNVGLNRPPTSDFRRT